MRTFILGIAIISCLGCSGGAQAPEHHGPKGGGGVGYGGSAGSEGPAGTAGTTSRATTSGRFGEPASSFTLPVSAPSTGELATIYHQDLGADFPEVKWDELDRLYLPAGEYKSIYLGGLPKRAVSRPLVITNLGGQVKVGGRAANYVFVLSGGSNWILTGRYDSISKTGDAAFRGHAEGRYAHSQGTYGIYVDDAFSKAGLSGISIGGKASDFELELLEVARVDFAGIVAKTDDDGSAVMRNVRLHDVYIHDTGSEGIYFGSTQPQPQHAFENLEIYQNRMLRTGTEALQIGQQGDGCRVYNNVLGPAATRWRSAFQRYQDGNIQYGQRYGSGRFENNIVIGTGDLFVEFFPTVVDGDPRSAQDRVTFANNYFADSSSGGVYTHAENTGVTIVFEKNLFTGFVFNYDEVYPDQAAPIQVFGVGSNSPNPHELRDNGYDASFPFVKWTFPSVIQQNNTSRSIERVKFRDFMVEALDANYRRLEFWTDVATLSPDQRAVSYDAGDLVVHQGTLYQAITSNTGKKPDEHPADWRPLPPPADDVRLAPDSPLAGLGLRGDEP